MRIVSTASLVGLLVVTSVAQQPKERWLRVYTGDDSRIELNVDSLSFAGDRVVLAEFRTIYSKTETLASDPKLKYGTRLEKIGFKLDGKEFRIYEIRLMDVKNNLVAKFPAESNREWRPMKPGGMMDRLFKEVRELPPFGGWEVIGYRYVDDVVDRTSGTPELERLIGQVVRFSNESIQIGTKSCRGPAYESKTITADELSKELGITVSPVGLRATSIEAITVRCRGSGWSDARSFLLHFPGGKRLMLWDGVFLVLKRIRS